MKQVLVIGGGVAAKGFLSSAVKFYKDAKFTFIRKNRKGPVPCGIPYAFGTLESPYDNVSPDEDLLKAGVELIIDEAIDVKTEEKLVILKDHGDLKYDKLVFAVGSEAVVPPFPGKDLENILVLEKDLDVVNKQKELITNARNIVIIGGGFIGVELADEIKNFRDKNVTIIELANNCLAAAFDQEYCVKAENILQDKGINVILNTAVTEFQGTKKIEKVVLANGKSVEADLVFLSIGVKPSTSLAQKAGVEVSPRHGIITDSYRYTSDPDILAIGDCASKIDFNTGKPSGIRLASVAAREGRIAAANLFGKYLSETPLGVISLFSTCIHGQYFAAAGMTQEQMDNNNLLYNIAKISTVDKHPSKLPKAAKIEGRFIFAQNTNVLMGVQLIGNMQIAELINFFGYAIQNKATAFDLYSLYYATHPLGTSAPNKYIAHLAGAEILKNIIQ